MRFSGSTAASGEGPCASCSCRSVADLRLPVGFAVNSTLRWLPAIPVPASVNSTNLTGGSLNIQLNAFLLSASFSIPFYHVLLVATTISRSRIERRARSTNAFPTILRQPKQRRCPAKSALQRHAVLKRFQLARQIATLQTFYCRRPGVQCDTTRSSSDIGRHVTSANYRQHGTHARSIDQGVQRCHQTLPGSDRGFEEQARRCAIPAGTTGG